MQIKSCENNPQIVISLDPVTDQYYVLTPQPIKKDPLLRFEPTQVQTAISPDTFTAQDAGIYSQKEPFWNRVLFTKTLIICFSFLVKLLAMNL